MYIYILRIYIYTPAAASSSSISKISKKKVRCILFVYVTFGSELTVANCVIAYNPFDKAPQHMCKRHIKWIVPLRIVLLNTIHLMCLLHMCWGANLDSLQLGFIFLNFFEFFWIFLNHLPQPPPPRQSRGFQAASRLDMWCELNVRHDSFEWIQL